MSAPAPTYVAGLDLGQANDPSAIAICEATMRRGAPPAPPRRHYAFTVLDRWPLGTTYTRIVEGVVRIFASPPLAGSVLCVDATGVGRPVLDMLRKAAPSARVRGIGITGGAQVTPSDDVRGWNVPKRDLAGTLQVLLGGGRIHFAPALPLAKVLLKEMQTFKVKINVATGNDSYEALREGDHDDLVLAVAMACWFGENHISGSPAPAAGGPRPAWQTTGRVPMPGQPNGW